MSTDQKLKKLDDFLHTFSTETGDGLCGEAGYYVFSYDPKDEMKVRQWTECEIRILQQSNRPVVEFDLYKIMTALLEEKHPRQKYEDLELRTGSMTRVVNAIILLTGVGKCYPLLRSHKILNDLHDRLADGIVLMMFPGRYEDGYLYLFSDVKDGNNYRAKPI